MKKAVFQNTEVDYCSKCLGLWFDGDELRQAKDEKEKDLNWLDIDLWKDEKKFKVSQGLRACPKCSVPLYNVGYGDSRVQIDLCNLCKGIWLDRGEFKGIVKYLKEKGARDLAKHYFKNLLKEGAEIVIGPETFQEELHDFVCVLKLLNYNVATKHPVISAIILTLPK